MKRLLLPLLPLSLLVYSPGRAHDSDGPHGGRLVPVGGLRVELVPDSRQATMTLYVLDDEDPTPRPIPARPFSVRVEPAETGAWSEAFEVRLVPIPRTDDPRGLASRFVGRDPGLAGLDRFEVALRLPQANAGPEVRLAVETRGGTTHWVCPMRCDGGRVHPEPGRCPVCNMALKRLEDAHGDHTPRHGGVLVMAPDGWHHLEAVLVRGELRLYFYNDFTQPIPAARYVAGSTVSLRGTGGDGDAAPPALEAIPLATSTGHGYLRAPLPGDLPMPVDVRVSVRLQPDDPDVFDFTFESFRD